jgi:hypothetical protein
VCTSTRIRTDGKHAHRAETIEQSAELWGCNKTTALLKSAEFAHRMNEKILEVMSREDLTVKQKREIAAVLSIPNIYEIEVSEAITLTLEWRPLLSVEGM